MPRQAVTALAVQMLRWIEHHPHWPDLAARDADAAAALGRAHAALESGDGFGALESAAGIGAQLHHAATRA